MTGDPKAARHEEEPEEDPEVRKVMLELGQAGYRARFEVNRNPLFALGALGLYRTDEELPLWVRQWLLEFAREVLRPALYWPATPERPERNLTPKKAVEQARHALALTRQGWNGVEEFRRFLNDDMLALLHARGVPARTLAKATGVEPRQIYTKAKRTRARWPRIKTR
jgi:hypothetical protein